MAHQVAHLLWTDEVALVAATDPSGFDRVLAQAMAAPDDFVDAGAASLATDALSGPAGEAALCDRWRAGRQALATALGDLAPGSRLPWFGPPMSAASMATARLMETWAHGQDVFDAFGQPREGTHRLRHVAHLAIRARGFAYTVHGEEPPDSEVFVELTAPDGSLWSWGDAEAAQTVVGPALDFCLLATRRRHRDDLGLRAVGPDADHWLDIIQAFAGPPGPGRASAGAVSA